MLDRIDSIARMGIKQELSRLSDCGDERGADLYDRCFGTHAGKGSAPVHSADVYDDASLSKTTGTLLL